RSLLVEAGEVLLDEVAFRRREDCLVEGVEFDVGVAADDRPVPGLGNGLARAERARGKWLRARGGAGLRDVHLLVGRRRRAAGAASTAAAAPIPRTASDSAPRP